MRVRLFRDQFQNGFVIQRGLLRLGEPRFAERLEPREVVRRDGVIRQQRRVEREQRAACSCRARPVSNRFLRSLKSGDGRARLRADGGVNRTRRNRPPRQRDLRLEHVMHRPGKIRRRLRRDDRSAAWSTGFGGGRGEQFWPADEVSFCRMFRAATKTRRCRQIDNQQHQPARKSTATCGGGADWMFVSAEAARAPFSRSSARRPKFEFCAIQPVQHRVADHPRGVRRSRPGWC